MKKSLPHAIVLGLSPTGLYVARELGRCGVPLLGVDREFSCAGVSRYFDKGGVWYEGDSSRLLWRLLEIANCSDSEPVLIPTSDHYIEFIAEHYATLKPVFRIAPCYANTAEVLLDKSTFHALCARYNVATPSVWTLANVDESLQIEGIPFPCILKPTLIHLAKPYMRGNKVFVVNSRNELLRLAKELPKASGSWQVQEIIPGEESRITLVGGYASGDASAEDTFTARKLRQYPPGFGSASKVISSHCEETRDITLQFIDAIGFRGLYGAEFKRDPRDEKLKIIEINPRPTLWFYASHAAGKRLAERAYCDLTGLPLPARNEQRDGVMWQYAIKDLASALFYTFKGKSFVFGAPDLSAGGATTSRCWAVFSPTDPMPFFAELYVYVSKFFRRLG